MREARRLFTRLLEGKRSNAVIMHTCKIACKMCRTFADQFDFYNYLYTLIGIIHGLKLFLSFNISFEPYLSLFLPYFAIFSLDYVDCYIWLVLLLTSCCVRGNFFRTLLSHDLGSSDSAYY